MFASNKNQLVKIWKRIYAHLAAIPDRLSLRIAVRDIDRSLPFAQEITWKLANLLEMNHENRVKILSRLNHMKRAHLAALPALIAGCERARLGLILGCRSILSENYRTPSYLILDNFKSFFEMMRLCLTPVERLLGFLPMNAYSHYDNRFLVYALIAPSAIVRKGVPTSKFWQALHQTERLWQIMSPAAQLQLVDTLRSFIRHDAIQIIEWIFGGTSYNDERQQFFVQVLGADPFPFAQECGALKCILSFSAILLGTDSERRATANLDMSRFSESKILSALTHIRGTDRIVYHLVRPRNPNVVRRMLDVNNANRFSHMGLWHNFIEQKKNLTKEEPAEDDLWFLVQCGFAPVSAAKLAIEHRWQTLLGEIVGGQVLHDNERRELINSAIWKRSRECVLVLWGRARADG